MIRCAVSQPAFLPWIGWFDIFDQADRMVLLDTVQFEKQSWQQRNRISTGAGLLTVTVPVMTRGRLKQPILEVELASSTFVRKFLSTLQMNYSRAPYFADVYGELEIMLPESGRRFGAYSSTSATRQSRYPSSGPRRLAQVHGP